MKVSKRSWARLRKAMYATASAVIGILVIEGVATNEEGHAWLLLVEPVLGMAFFNVDVPDKLSDEAQVPNGN